MRRFMWMAPLAVAGTTLLGCGTESSPSIKVQGPGQPASQGKVVAAAANEVVLNVPGMT